MQFRILCSVMLALVIRASGDEILGCGGFVKSDIDINFSDVEVKLYTKQGSLKDQTDCAPNNGYYFLPLYDKGEYVLKIHPPAGWTFEPEVVSLNVDGTTDACSKGQDINFIFKGFAISGKVVSAGARQGPKGVKVALSLEGQSAAPHLYETSTGDDGSFQFTPVLPGQYIIKASHPKWKMVQDIVQVQVTKGNADVGDRSLVVAGYDVSGSVTSDDEPIKGVSFVLFHTEEGKPPPAVTDCNKSPLPGFRSSSTPLCHVTSDDHGTFLFPSIPPGKYRVVPHYEGPHSIKFDVRPIHVDFTVSHDSLKIKKPFQVKGFSVSGKLLLGPDGKGIEGATILLDGSIRSVTKSDGSYHLENMQAGTYKLQVVASDMQFQDTPVKITPNTPQLADIYPSAFKVCGSITPHHLTTGVAERGPRNILISKKGSESEKITLKLNHGSGEFCHFLAPGKYEASVEVTEEEKNRGLQFAPVVHSFEITDHPVLSGIVFSQLKVQLSGELLCLNPGNDCGDIPVVLNTIPPDNDNTKIPVGITVARDSHFTFSDVLPGKYQVSVDKEDWCWESVSHIVSVNTAQSRVPAFRHTGFSVTIISSHNTNVQYKLVSEKSGAGSVQNLSVERGVNKACVNLPGAYEFVPAGCHKYSPTVFLWNSAAASPIKLTAVAHTVGGSVKSKQKVNDLIISVFEVESEKLKARIGPLEPQLLNNGQYEYKFQLHVVEGERLRFVPAASTLLFTPVKSTLSGPSDCTDKGVEFYADKGHIIEGKIEPPLDGVKVSVFVEGSEEIIASTDTSTDGKFKFGPLSDGLKYRVSAEKEGYVLSGPDAKTTFKAHKLAEIVVEVIDKADGKPLQGVLLSLSGGESFRRNSQTDADGKRTFSSLSPSEYYLRPMMKEYRFEPSSKMITVVEGASIKVQLMGHQVAFSAYGTVTSLSGDSEEGIVVEAVGRDSCSQYQEESTSEANGKFRIRGLQPQCEYTVRVKQGPGVNQHIYRATPDGIPVKTTEGDIKDIRLIVFYPLTQMDVTANVQAPNVEHLRTLRAKLCREDAPESPIHVVKLDSTPGRSTKGHNAAMIMFPPIPADGRNYFLQLESTLSRATHTYTTHAVHFRANSSFKHIKLTFQPEPKVVEQDIGHTSYMTLPLIIIVVLAYINRVKVVPVLNRLVQSLNTPASPQSSGSGRTTIPQDHNAADAVMVEPILNVRSRKIKPRKT
ncbi:nodal modulator 3 [Schistocerca cancellata]|uniref:nodal modulator 3 n=1 Tax=Schistocerca cancellata TaxID=274614 RepID=UPI0021184D41|nr:nodal modulator 3 [Schistocerca cancellata]